MNYGEFIDRVAAKGGLDREHAEVATQVVLSVLGESLSEREVRHLSSQLARELKTTLENVPGHSRPYTAEEFLRLAAGRHRRARTRVARGRAPTDSGGVEHAERGRRPR